MKGSFKVILQTGGIGLAVILSAQSYAAGYKMEFQSASVLADSGEAAVVEDAGTNWYNSAGLVDLPQQYVLGAINLYSPDKFSGNVNAPSTLNLLAPPAPAFANNFTANGTASSHSDALIPAVHYSQPINSRFSVGISLVPAWGFSEDYGEGSILRYNLTRVYTKTIDIAPSIAMRLNSQWSFGFGPDFNYFSVESKTHVRTQGTLPPLAGTANDSISRFSADRWGFGGHAGVLFSYDDHTRIGLNYRSKVMMNLEGHSDFGLDGGPSFETNQFKLGIPLPPVTTLSVYRDITPCWAIMGTVAYDQWSTIRDYHARNYIEPPIPPSTSGIIPNVTLVQNMNNTFDYGIGTHIKINPQLMLRANIKYMPTPTKTAYREVDFPDGEKLGFEIGARYWVTKRLALDGIYGHVFIRTMNIHDVNPVTLATATGRVSASVDLVGGQLVFNL